MNHNTSITNNSDWNRLTLGDLIDVLTDYTANGSFEALKLNVTYYTEQNYSALVRTTDLEKKNFKPERFTDKRGHDFQKKTALYGGEIVLANVGSVGKVYRVPTYDAPMTLAPNTYLVKFSKKHCDEYIFQFLKSEYYLSALYRNISSTTLAAINKDNFRSIPIDVPKSLSEQEKIANILNTVDNLIDQTQNLIDKYTAVKQGMMSDMFSRGIDLSGAPETNKNFGQLRPSYEEASDLYQETELGFIPKDWSKSNLKESCSAIGDGVHYSVNRVSQGVPFLFVSCIKNGEIQWDNAAYISQKTYEEISKNCKPYDGLLLFTAVGSYGQVAYVDSNQPFGFERNIAYLKPVNSIIKSRYLFYLLHAQMIKSQVESLVMGNAQKLISLGNLGRIIIPIPSENEQNKITEKLDSVGKKIDSEKTLLDKYKSIKKGLMQDLLTGKVKV